MFTVQIDLKRLPLSTRNKIINIVKVSRCYYSLENQVLRIDFKTMLKISKYLEEN